MVTRVDIGTKSKHMLVYLCVNNNTHILVQTHKLDKDCPLPFIHQVLNTPERSTERLCKKLRMCEDYSNFVTVINAWQYVAVTQRVIMNM